MAEKLAHHYLADSAVLFPTKNAVTDGLTEFTYGDLDASTDQLAHLLSKLGVTRGNNVAYFLKRGSRCILATLGILKTGAAYIPLDQKTPIDRWSKIIRDAKPLALICDNHTLAESLKRSVNLPDPLQIVCLTPGEDKHKSIKNLYFLENTDNTTGIYSIAEASLDDVAYIMYTSGSTGSPKGVMITHRNITNYVNWATSYFDISSEDRLLGTAPFYFDMSTFDIFCTLKAGATLFIASEEATLFPEFLARLIESERLTLWKGVSSLIMYLSRAGIVKPGRMSSLRTVIFAGEPLATQYLSNWMQNLQHISFFNGYGPTEATGISLCYHVDHVLEPDQPIPIGRPCKGAKVAVVDDDGLPVHPGNIGELLISGSCLAKGYFNDPVKTQSSFTLPPQGSGLEDRVYWTGDLVRQTPEGDYVFVSRKDYQVKWMGYRIELGEIETNLISYPHVRDAAVLLKEPGRQGLTELIAFIESDKDLDVSALGKYLEKKLPLYMIPKRFIRVQSLPRNDRGKVNREELVVRYSTDESIPNDGTT